MKMLNAKRLEENIEKIARYDLDNNCVFGSSYKVFQNGKTVLKKHFGSKDENPENLIDDGSIFRLASMTKPITAVATLILVERGLVSLDDPVSKYISSFKDIHIIEKNGRDMGKAKNEATVLNLLTHTSGFGSQKEVLTTAKDRESISDTVDCFCRAGLDFEPFAMQAYSPVAAFDALAAIAEKVSNISFDELLKKEIFDKCNMKDTTFSPSDEQWRRVVKMHNRIDEKSCVYKTVPNCVFENYPCSHKLAGAGLVSTLEDYSRFAEMLLKKGKTKDFEILSEKTFEKIYKPYVPKSIMRGNESWGLGVRVITDSAYGALPVGAYGWSGAYGSHFWIDYENGVYAVFMKNSKFDGGSGNKSACRFEDAVNDAFMA